MLSPAVLRYSYFQYAALEPMQQHTYVAPELKGQKESWRKRRVCGMLALVFLGIIAIRILGGIGAIVGGMVGGRKANHGNDAAIADSNGAGGASGSFSTFIFAMPTAAWTTSAMTSSSTSESANPTATPDFTPNVWYRPRPFDAIFALCSLDTRIAERGAQLFLDGYGSYLIFSGDVGKLTAGRFAKPEAQGFADIARSMGVADDRIIVESKATNTGKNVRIAHGLLQQIGRDPRSFILVQKPYMERRAYATFMKQWPDPKVTFTVTSPQLSFSEYPDAENPRDLVISIMVGDLVRIRDYSAMGF